MPRIRARLVHTFAILLLVVAGASLAQEPEVRLELTPRAEVPAGTTTLVARDVSQWICMQSMPSAVIVPVNVALSDRAEETRAPAAEDVTAWFELAEVAGASGVDVTLERVDQIWDVTEVGAGGIAFRVFCRVVVAVTLPDAANGEAGPDVDVELTLRNLGEYAFPLSFPLRIVGE